MVRPDIEQKWPYFSEDTIKIGPKYDIFWKNLHWIKVRKRQSTACPWTDFPQLPKKLSRSFPLFIQDRKKKPMIPRVARSEKIRETQDQLLRIASSAAGHRISCPKDTRTCTLRASELLSYTRKSTCHTTVSTGTPRAPRTSFPQRHAAVPGERPRSHGQLIPLFCKPLLSTYRPWAPYKALCKHVILMDSKFS